MAEPVVTPPIFARPSRFRDFLGVSDYLRDLHRTLTLGLTRYADALNTGVAQYGTWTPGVTAGTTAGTPAYTTQEGTYTLRGADVVVWGHIDLSGWTGSPAGDVSITGLPFAALGTSAMVVPWFAGINMTASYNTTFAHTSADSTSMFLAESGDAVGPVRIQASAITAADFLLIFTHTYRTNLQ